MKRRPTALTLDFLGEVKNNTEPLHNKRSPKRISRAPHRIPAKNLKHPHKLKTGHCPRQALPEETHNARVVCTFRQPERSTGMTTSLRGPDSCSLNDGFGRGLVGSCLGFSEQIHIPVFQLEVGSLGALHRSRFPPTGGKPHKLRPRRNSERPPRESWFFRCIFMVFLRYLLWFSGPGL